VNKLFSVFPAGPPGVALLLLRMSSAGLSLGALIYFAQRPDWSIFACIVLAAALIFGAFTRVAATVCIIAAVFASLSLDGALGFVVALQGLNAAALALLGAGAYSIDAHMFGRFVITLDK